MERRKQAGRGNLRAKGWLWLTAAAWLLAGAPRVVAQQASTPEAGLTLAQAVVAALERNPALRAAGEERNAARAQREQARAMWLPRVDFSQSLTGSNNPVYVFGTKLTQRRFTAADFALPSLNAPTPIKNHQSRIDGQWLLFDSLARENRVSAARRLESAADFETEQARQDLILRVVRAYYSVVVARENVRAARESLALAEASEKKAAAMEQAGLAVLSDLLSAQVFRAQMKEREIRAVNQLELARLSLAHEMGEGAAAGEPLESLEDIPLPAGTAEEWAQRSLASRPALRAAELQQQAAQHGAKSAQLSFGPKVGAFASFERDADTLAGGSSGTNWTAGLRVEMNLFAGGADRARLAEARARERQAASQLEWFRSGVKLEVRQAYLETQAAQQRVAATAAAVEQARESLRILQNRYDAGLATMTDLLRAQSALLEARTAQLAALHDARVSRAALERAAGVLAPDSGVVREAAQ